MTSSTNAKRYWRSLEQLAGSPEALDFAEREFPEGASEPPDGMTRRSMVMLAGASLSMLGLTACRRPVEHIVPYVRAPEEIIPGVPLYYATTMPFGRSSYGLVVESHEGRPTKIEGNKLHPRTNGSSHPWVQASILGLYDQDRSQKVTGSDGESRSWADFESWWSSLSESHQEDGGAGLRVVAEQFSSPTTARLRKNFLQIYPNARWVTWEPVSDSNVIDGIEMATGERHQPVYAFDRARVILVLDGDPLYSDREAISHGAGFADGRRDPDGDMNRLYVVESGHSITGSMADHRQRLASNQIAALVSALAGRLAKSGAVLDAGGAAVADPLEGRFIDAVAADLAANRGRCLIIAGDHQPPEVHAAVFALNEALGSHGETVTFHNLDDGTVASASELNELVDEINNGVVSTLVMLGGNPLYSAPAQLGFATALAAVENTIHFSGHRNETSLACGWHLPMSHYLERWGDARAVGGQASLIQPLIAPLYDSRSIDEVVNLLASGSHQSDLDVTQETWRSVMGVDFERTWLQSLHDGVIAGAVLETTTPVVSSPVVAQLAGGSLTHQPPPTSAGLELVLRPSPSVFDGRFSNNGWLQELPETLTKMTWDNAALMSPTTAANLGVANEELVLLEIAEQKLELPVWVLPGHADNAVTVWLGYGRSAAGRVGNGVGANAYPLRASDGGNILSGLKVSPTGRPYQIAQTQDHGSMEGRPLVREATVAQYRANPSFAPDMDHHPPLKSAYPDHNYDEGPQWGMAIDLNTCTGCNACVMACQSENNIPVVGKDQVRRGREMHWLRIDRYFSGDPDDNPEVVVQPIPCMQCENAPCEEVCPVAATVHDEEGLNVMAYNRCIGTRYCGDNCPYKVRRFNFYNFTKDTTEAAKLAMNPDVTVRSRGVMEKCTYCTQRINGAKISAKLAGRALADGDVLTACQQSCPSKAITFGDIRDQSSTITATKSGQRNYVLLAELNNRPRTSYLARVRNPNPQLEGTA